MDLIDAILYINLEHRVDRDKHIRQEINKLCKDLSKIHRIDALYKNPGELGCGLSHIKALEYAFEHSNWKHILILEDDFTFKSSNTNEINNDIELLFKTHIDINVGLLSSNLKLAELLDTKHFRIKKVISSQTTSSYIIKREYIPKLLDNFKAAITDMMENGVKHENCIDQHWKHLQPNDNWYILYPPIGYQYDNYSDIEQRFVAYKC